MPTVIRIHGMRVMIHTNDHRPAHVHVFGGGGEEAEFWLNCPDGPPELRIDHGMSNVKLRRIAAALAAALPKACASWEEIHGAY